MAGQKLFALVENLIILQKGDKVVVVLQDHHQNPCEEELLRLARLLDKPGVNPLLNEAGEVLMMI